MGDLLVSFLASVDDRLLDYVDENKDLRLDTVKRLWLYTNALSDRSITPAVVEEDWPDWFNLVAAFRAAYAPEWLRTLEEAAPILKSARVRDTTRLTKADRAYLLVLESLLQMHYQGRKAEER
jgi:hypothetical protein